MFTDKHAASFGKKGDVEHKSEKQLKVQQMFAHISKQMWRAASKKKKKENKADLISYIG